METSYSLITENIRVTVRPAPLQDNSDPHNGEFAFSYTIRIENLGPIAVQLLERHWQVVSADTQVAEVVGPGVAGKQPVIEGGQNFEYTSGTVIKDPVGSMFGAYTFRTEEGRMFQVRIPRFELLYPVMYH